MGLPRPLHCARSRWFPRLPSAPLGTGSPAHSAAPAPLAGPLGALAWRRGARRDAGEARPRARGVGLDVRRQDGGSGRALLEAPVPGRRPRRGPPAGEPRRGARGEGWREGRGDGLHVRGRRRTLRGGGAGPGEECDPLPPPGVLRPDRYCSSLPPARWSGRRGTFRHGEKREGRALGPPKVTWRAGDD